MKQLLIISLVFLFTIFPSCVSDKTDGVKVVPDKLGNNSVVTFEYDGCEYISVYSSSGSFAIAHKGNCKYCKARK